MAESSSTPENCLLNLRSILSNEHLVFAETLRDWRDPLLQGHAPLPILLCPRCATCKCASLKTFRKNSIHKHHPSCPNFRHHFEQTKSSNNKQRIIMKTKRRSNSHDSSIMVLNPSLSIMKSKPIEHSPLVNSIQRKKLSSKIPVRISTNSPIISNKIKMNDLFDTDSLNEDTYQTPPNDDISLKQNNQLDYMDEQVLIKKKKRHKRQKKHRHIESRHSKSKQASNDSSSSSSSSSSKVPLKNHSQSYHSSSSLSDDSLSEKVQNHSSLPPSIYIIQSKTKPNELGLSKTVTYVWKNTKKTDDNEVYPRYSIEQIPPLNNEKKSLKSMPSRNITLQRGQYDYWQNFQPSPESIITSSCEKSTGSASHLLSSNKKQTNSNGHIISITTTKRSQPSLLNKIQNTKWNIEHDGKQTRYSIIKWHSDEHLNKHNHVSKQYMTDSGSSSEQNNRSAPVIINTNNIPQVEKNPPILESIKPKQISYASTDEDVDELNSHYSEDIERSISIKQNLRDKFQTRLNDLNENSLSNSKILSNEYSQITFDSGVDIISEQKIYQPNTTVTIDEQSSEELTDQNDLFALSDDSLIEIQPQSIDKTEQDLFFSAKSEVVYEKDPYSGYELETISDEDDEYQLKNEDSKEIIITSEPSPPPSSSSSKPSIPPQFEFKLPSFGEWIDRVFTTFLSETNPNPSKSISSSRSSSSHVITVLENLNHYQTQSYLDDDHSLNDMSSSSLNSEKVDFDTYIINSNYEKINPSVINEQNEIPFINQPSKSLLSSITSSIENHHQEMMNNDPMQTDDHINKKEYQYSSNSHDSLLQSSSINDLTKPKQFHSKDSALDLSDENLNQKIDHNNQMMVNTSTTIDDEIINHSNERTISSSSSEQLIPKEKHTGMYYKAFGSSAAIHLAEQYRCEWLQESSSSVTKEKTCEIDDNQLRIVHQSEIIGDNEDEFYFSPQTLHPSYSCPNLYSLSRDNLFPERSYSLTTLDAYTNLNITHETLEQIWLSLLDVAFSDKDDYELGEYKLRHIIGLSNSYSNMNQTVIEKSRSHNDIYSINQKSITKNKSKSFDITTLIKQSPSYEHDSSNMGLLQGADISEPFGDRLISTSMHSDIESIHSIEQEPIPNENPPTPPPPPPSIPLPIVTEPLDFVFNYSQPTILPEELDLTLINESEIKPLNISITYDTEDILPIVPIRDVYTELALFRPHSLSTIPSSRASQYASSVESDDEYEHEHQLIKDNELNHISDDDHGVIGSEFSSPQSRPLSSINSRPLSPEQNQHIKTINFSDIDHIVWKQSLDDTIFDQHLPEEFLINDHLTAIFPIESKQIDTIDQIEPILSLDKNQDHITNEESSKLNIENLSSIINDIQQINQIEKLRQKQIPKPSNNIPIRYQTQRIDKVSDLEIVKQGKGFKIGYIDRQGTDQRVILTKRIEGGEDILQRDPNIRLPYKGQRILNQMHSSVLYTNGYNSLREDTKFQRSSDDIEVPIIGTNPKHFDESDMISIDIDGPSTMLDSICESIVITQGSVYSKPEQNPANLLQKKEKIEIIDLWHDQTIINGSGIPWRSPLKPPKTISTSSKSTRDIALSPITFPETIDRSCQYSPPQQQDQGLQCYFESISSQTQVSPHDIPGLLKTQNDNSTSRTMIIPPRMLERSADSGILVDDNHRMKTDLGLQVDLKSSSSDSEDISEINPRQFSSHISINHNYENINSDLSTNELEQEIVQLRRERAHVLDLLSLNWNRSNIWVELTEAKLNYIIGETDALLRSLSFDPNPIDNESVKLKMNQYEEDMAELTRQHLVVYRKRLEDSKKELDNKIDELELRKSSIENYSINRPTTFEHIPRSKRTNQSFLSTSVENLTNIQDKISSHPHLLDVSFLTSKNSDQHETIRTLYRPTPRYAVGNLSHMEGLSKSQQAILDETDKLVKDSQQLHTESASQFERARESLLSSETSIRLARENMAATRHSSYSEKKSYLPHDVTLAELFKYEQLLTKQAAKNRKRQIYSTTES